MQVTDSDFNAQIQPGDLGFNRKKKYAKLKI